MESNKIFQLSWPGILNLFSTAKTKIRIILPSIHLELAEALKDIKAKGIDIKICLNNSEKYIRDGFGDNKAIQKLIDQNIPVNESSKNQISLISVDQTSFLYFPTSRIFEDFYNDSITNAVMLDKITAISMLSAFFPEDLVELRKDLVDNSSVIMEINNQLEDTIEDLSLGKINKLSKSLDINTFQQISQNLEINPPLEPDLKRSIEVYNLKVQFVELKFENGKIAGRRVSIPKNALPFESPELKRILDAGMKIFIDEDENEKKTFESYASIQKDVKILRDKYLKPIKCRSDKSILIKKDAMEFLKDIETINKKILAAKSNLINDIDIEIEKSRERLGKELYQFFLKNPPRELKDHYSSERIPSKCSDYVHRIIDKMKFPEPHKMVEGMKLISRFYDLTWNDLSDKELLNEFEEKGILKDDLDSIRQLKPAFDIRQ